MNLEVLDRAETTSIEAMILKAQLHWTWHIIWMDDLRKPKQLLLGKLSQGKWDQGMPQKHYKDCIKTSITFAGLNLKQFEVCAKDWVWSHAFMKKAHANFKC